MGSKIEFGLFRYLLVIILAFNISSVFAQDTTKITKPAIPQSTVKQPIRPINVSDGAKTVRVAINDSSFKSILYNQVTVLSSKDFVAYDKSTHKVLAKFLVTDTPLVKYACGKFEIDLNNKPIVKDFTGTIIFDSPQGFLSVKGLKRCGTQAIYHGTFELTPKNECQFYLINVLNLQDYLKGVVPNEMPVRFGLEALKAQSIAARNYVLMPRTRVNNIYDVDDSVASQVYFGAGSQKALSNEAVYETTGLVALYGWDMILAQYCSTAGGYTENYENAFSDAKNFPGRPRAYLKGRPDIYTVAPITTEDEARKYYMSTPDSYDMHSPYYRWKREFKSDELKTVLQKTLITQSKTGFVKPEFKDCDTLENIKEIKVTKRGISGKIMEMDVITDTKTYHVSKEIVIRKLIQKDGISLPSANVVFDNQYDENKNLTKLIAYGGGFGHGVGMSQYGAGFMATSLHKPFDKILKRYYTGITISTIPLILSESNGQKALIQEFFAPYTKAILVVDNKYQIKEINANINGRNVAFALATGIVPFNRYSRIDISSYLKKGKNRLTFYFPDNNNGKAIRLYVELVGKDDSEYCF